MTFDPFGDFATKGYLRNNAGDKDRAIVKRLEHTAFTTGLGPALDALMKRGMLSYADVLRTHQTLFDAVYPWAGQDRTTTAPELAITKGEGAGKVRFADPRDIRLSVDYALQRGQNKALMASKPGEIMGYLAFGHPFLDGNGRTIMAVHCVLAQRAGIRIDWAATSKDDYLDALTRELNDPGKGHLDTYLEPFVHKSAAGDDLAAIVTNAPGLDGNASNIVAGKIDDKTLRAEYEAQKSKRKDALG